jgi:hypothetical protein
LTSTTTLSTCSTTPASSTRPFVEEDGKALHSKARKQQILSYRALKLLIRRRYMTKLALAKFDPKDAALLASAGACTTCPSRSGNQPELPGRRQRQGRRPLHEAVVLRGEDEGRVEHRREEGEGARAQGDRGQGREERVLPRRRHRGVWVRRTSRSTPTCRGTSRRSRTRSSASCSARRRPRSSACSCRTKQVHRASCS